MAREINYLSMVDTILEVKIDVVNEWEERFLIDMKKRYATHPEKLSEKQQDCIKNIYSKYVATR